MFAKIISRRWVTVSQKTLIVMLALVVMLGSLSVDRAKAWAIQGTGGNGIIVHLPQIDVSDITQPEGAFLYILGSGLTVQRSSLTTGTQNITVVYLLEKYTGNNKWQAVRSQVYTGQLVAGGFYNYTFPDVELVLPVTSRGYFRVTFGAVVADANGNFLSGATVSSNHVSDYICTYAQRPCQSFPGYFRIGLYNTNSW